MWNHHLLTTISQRPPWLTIEGGAERYIDAVMKECKHAHVHLGTPVQSLTSTNGRVELSLGGQGHGRTEIFDSVILACHGNQARHLVDASVTFEESGILAAFETTPNTAYLHSDLSLMPKRRSAWSAWNYLTTSSPSVSQKGSGDLQTVSLTYNMNILQHIPVSDFSNVLVTLNPKTPPMPSLTQATCEYQHPLYNGRTVAAQIELENIQGKRGIWYAGAWTGYGFHEDGFSSGMRVGLRLGGDVPWEVKDAKFSRGIKPILGWQDHMARLMILVLQTWIRVLEAVVGAKRGNQISISEGALSNGDAVQAKKQKAS
jgi:predicted NAD/FAD-binding protein